jgi:hypothetical protein
MIDRYLAAEKLMERPSRRILSLGAHVNHSKS